MEASLDTQVQPQLWRLANQAFLVDTVAHMCACRKRRLTYVGHVSAETNAAPRKSACVAPMAFRAAASSAGRVDPRYTRWPARGVEHKGLIT
jgi:hypothetical protein